MIMNDPMPSLNTAHSSFQSSPFDLDNEEAFSTWTRSKLEQYPRSGGDLLVDIADPFKLTESELTEIRRRCRLTNMAIFQLPTGRHSKTAIASLGRQLGLHHLDCNLLSDEDCLTSLRFEPGKNRRGYIPYSNRRINWHTDGYYNDTDHMIRGMLLYCDMPALEGGENCLLDHEIVYLQLRQQDPELVRALMQDDAMGIPPNDEPGKEIRGMVYGPVFSIDDHGNLHMRYTARTRSIKWKDDAVTRAAVEALQEIMNADSPWKFTLKLNSGQGLICNNVLHTRTDFDQSLQQSPRLLYRARYFDRIEETDTAPI